MAKRKISPTDQLRRAIDESGYSRYAICKATGIDQSSLGKFCAGKGWLSIESFDALGEFIGLTITLRQKPSNTTDD
jgi:transcriptional regulator with XRE-family HTH domain